jgi:hypothetical protein
VRGAPTYNGATDAELAASGVALTRLASYAPERDEHEPLLTVRETFNFSHATAVGIPIAAAHARAEAAAAASARRGSEVWGWCARAAGKQPPPLVAEAVRVPAPPPAPPPPPLPSPPPQPPPEEAAGVVADADAKAAGEPRLGSGDAAAAAHPPGDSYWLHPRTAEEMVELLQLREAADTIVGSAAVRGVSGGQRKRVTIGEALMQGARVLALDSITSGLDASTAYATCRYLTEWARRSGECREVGEWASVVQTGLVTTHPGTHLPQPSPPLSPGGTVIAALQQATPETGALFDDALLLADGLELYHGPMARLEEYLGALGA